MALNYILNVPNSEGGYDRIPALKGDKGDKGDRGATGLNGAYNPNLLINSNFAINQRGESSYTGNNSYTVDMWQLATADVTLTKLTNGIGLTISASKATGTNYFLLQQKIEDYAFYANKKVTATIKYSNNVGTKALNLRADSTSKYSGTFTATSGEITFTFTLGSISTSLALIVTGHHTNGTAETINIEYIKLELGENATEYTPPQLASELAKCQRYFIDFRGSGIKPLAFGAWRENVFRCFITLPNTLAKTPTILSTLSNLRILRYDTGGIITPTAITVAGISNTVLALHLTTSTQTLGAVGNLYQEVGDTLFGLSAEL